MQRNKFDVLPSIITLHFANAGITDNIDLMRCNLFGLAISNFINKNNRFDANDAYSMAEYNALPFCIDSPSMAELVDKINTFMFSGL